MPEDLQHPSGQPNPNIRVSDAEREQVIAQLHRNTEEGRLEISEFNDRAESVYAAKTYGELQTLLEDLPEVSVSGTAVAPVAGHVTPARDAPASLELNPKASTVKKRGRWHVPREIIVKSAVSDITLDFTEAVVSTKEIDIMLDDKGSDLWLILPDEGMYVVDDITLKAASVKNECDSGANEAVRINVTGKLTMSDLKIRRKRHFLWWSW